MNSRMTMNIFIVFVSIIIFLLAIMAPYLEIQLGRVETPIILSAGFLGGITTLCYCFMNRENKISITKMIFELNSGTVLLVSILFFSASLLLLSGRVSEIREGRKAKEDIVSDIQFGRIMHAAENFATDKGKWPPSIISLFYAGRLSVKDLSDADKDRASLIIKSRPVDAENKIEAILGIVYIGSGISTQSDPNVVIMRSRVRNSSGKYLVGVSTGEIKELLQ